jgi:hypothetical protein
VKDLEIRKKARVNVRDLLFEIVEQDEADFSEKRHLGYVYIIEKGRNTVPAFLWSLEKVGLGNQELNLITIENSEELYAANKASFGSFGPTLVHDERTLMFVLKADAFLRYQHRAQCRAETRIYPDGHMEKPDQLQVFAEICDKFDYFVYAKTLPVPLKELKALTKTEVEDVMEDYVCHGWELAPEIFAIMKAGLIRFRPDAANSKLMKYRGHALIVKPPKTGVSSISMRIGTNIDQLSTKSIEGHASADGDITYSSLHDTWGHVNVDEFLEMDEGILQHMFNFIELGQFETHKASRVIRNYGAPRMCFTANPQDIEGLDFSAALTPPTQTTADGQVLLDVGNDRAKLMYSLFKESLKQLTKVSSAAFSRLGVIIFTPELKPAQRTDKAYDMKYLDTADAVAESILEYTKAETTQIFTKMEKWLNKPILDYEKKLDKLLKKCSHPEVKNAWNGQKDAFRHVRGHALSEAIIDNLHAILHGKVELADIQESAEINLQYITETNLRSLQHILSAVEKYDDNPEILKAEIENLRPAYLKAFLVAYAVHGAAVKETVAVPLEMLGNSLNQLDLETRKAALGEYWSWTRFSNLLNPHKIRRVLSTVLSEDIFGPGDTVLLKPRIVEKLRKAFALTECGKLLEEEKTEGAADGK